MDIPVIAQQILKHEQRIARERDSLDAFIAQLSDLRDTCDRTAEALQEARDSLSELV